MRFLRLRFAVSAVFGPLCIWLIELWVDDCRNTRLVASEPYAFPTLLTAGAAIAPWASGRTRFSLRTLLIAVTLVELVLGLGVWLAS